uniref:VP1 n=1 Tax=Sapovirus 1 rodent/Manhattan/2013 TaxID=1562071 RepID=A0A097NZ64_9CALI|nr:VP1 [Sapovirus 1 rodent/Manhattan/2013]
MEGKTSNLAGPRGSAPAPMVELSGTDAMLVDGVQGPTAGPPVQADPTPPNVAAMAAAATAASGSPPDNVGTEVRGTMATAATFTWPPRGAPGALVGSIVLGPQSNPYLNHLSMMYTGWSGSIVVRVSVSGSGIYAGRLAAAILPPGVRAADVRNPGAYPHALVDARTTTAFTLPVFDVRNVDFHYYNDQMVQSLGIWVFQPLINPFDVAGNTTATVTVETCPGPDFQFMLLRPPGDSTGASDPSDLFPTNLLLARDNRMGLRPTALVGVNAAYQVNHHFDANGETFGWSSVPLGQVAVRVSTSFTQTNTQPGLYFAAVDAPLQNGIPNHWPDFCATANFSGGNSLAAATGAGGTLISLTGSTDVEQERAATVRFMSAATGGLRPDIEANTLAGWVYNGQSPSVGNDSFTHVDYVEVTGRAVNERVANVAGRAYTFSPQGGNNIVLFVVNVPRTAPGSTTIYSSQLESTAMVLADHGAAIPPGSMAVYNITAGANTFQVGLGTDGYLRSGFTAGQVVTLGPDTTFNYSGLYSLSTPLPSPSGNSGRARLTP